MDMMTRLASTQGAISGIVPQHGGIIRCETCGRTEQPHGSYMSTGWPKCHGYTMRWWTQGQIDAGEMPVLG